MVLDLLAQALRAVGKRITDWQWDGPQLMVSACSTVKSAACPVCGRRSRRLHGCYHRRLAECPCLGHPVWIDLEVRRFRCRNRRCPRRTFAERVEPLTLPRQRSTGRLAEARRYIALALGGKAGARLAALLGMAASGDTLLRLLRRSPPAAPEEPLTVVGIDDWALARGHCYGTIVVDLQRRRPVALLPDRDTATVRDWLKEHDSIRIMARDRASAYADAVRQALPDAVQVADRWHLIKNLSEALQRLLSRLSSRLREAANDKPAVAEDSNASSAPADVGPPSPPPTPTATRAPAAQRRVDHNRERRLALYEEVMQLHTAGRPLRAIARELGLDRRTVRHFVQSQGFPERAVRAALPGSMDSIKPYLQARAAQGCTNAAQIWRELVDRGVKIGHSCVRLAFQALRLPDTAGTSTPPAQPGVKAPSPSRACAWLLGWKERHCDESTAQEHQRFAVRLCELEPAVATARKLALRFMGVLTNHDSEGLEQWLVQAESCEVIEMQRFAAGLQEDLAAVRAAVALPWSSGQVEGQNNRLKLIKRQMYGQADLDLLEIRVVSRA
jgi:transposase